MRIISGKAKGKKLYSPKGRGTRPTADRVKESLFDILGDEWEGMRVLDLFSGTGSLGLEALSRGAEQAVFVEKNRHVLNVLRRNIALCGFDPHTTVLAMPVPQGLTFMGHRGESFHVIFADPPYGKGWVEPTIEGILTHRVLCVDGMIVIEHAPAESPSRDHGTLLTLRQKRFGETVISFLGFEMADKEKSIAASDAPSGRLLKAHKARENP